MNTEMKKFAEIVEVDGRQVLFYVEPSGDQYVMHQVTLCAIGTVDMKLEFACDIDTTAEVFEYIKENLGFEDGARQLIAKVDGLFTEDDSDG